MSLVATRSMYVRRLSLVGTNSLYVCTPVCVLGQYTGLCMYVDCLWLVRILCTYVHHCVSLVSIYTGIYCNCRPTYASLRIVGLSIILQQRTRYMMSLVCLWLSWD